MDLGSNRIGASGQRVQAS